MRMGQRARLVTSRTRTGPGCLGDSGICGPPAERTWAEVRGSQESRPIRPVSAAESLPTRDLVGPSLRRAGAVMDQPGPGARAPWERWAGGLGAERSCSLGRNIRKTSGQEMVQPHGCLLLTTS